MAWVWDACLGPTRVWDPRVSGIRECLGSTRVWDPRTAAMHWYMPKKVFSLHCIPPRCHRATTLRTHARAASTALLPLTADAAALEWDLRALLRRDDPKLDRSSSESSASSVPSWWDPEARKAVTPSTMNKTPSVPTMAAAPDVGSWRLG